MPLNTDVFKSVHLLSGLFLTLDITLIFYLYLGSLGNFLLAVCRTVDNLFQVRKRLSEPIYRDSRTGYEFVELTSVVEWGRTDAFKSSVYLFWLYVCSVAVIDDFSDMLLFL